MRGAPLARSALPRDELAGLVLAALHHTHDGRQVVDLEIVGEGEDWRVATILGPAGDALSQVSWTLAVIEARLRDSFALAGDGVADEESPAG